VVVSEERSSFGCRRTNHSTGPAWSLQPPRQHVDGRENGESQIIFHQSRRERGRVKPALSVSSSVVDYQGCIRSLRDTISLYQQQQQHPHPISMDIQTKFSIENEIQKIKDVTTTNEECFREIFQVIVDLLLIHNTDDELAHVLLLTMEAKLRFANDQNIHITMTKDQALRVVQRVAVVTCRQHSTGTAPPKFYEAPTSSLPCLALLVKSQVEILPAEDTAQSVVMAIFLPFLEQQQQQQQQRHKMDPKGNHHHMANTCAVCQALVILLQHQRHASSLLAPLVQDIALKDGMERTFENPIRRKLLQVMSQLLAQLGTDRESLALEASFDICSVITVAVESIRALNQNHTAVVAEGNYLVDALKTFFFSVLLRTVTSQSQLLVRNSSLLLLRRLLARYPNSMTLVGWKVLIEDYRKFLPLFFAPSSSNGCDVVSLKVLSIDVLSDFIFSLPWKRWLNQETPYKQSNTTGLYRKVATALESLLSMLQYEFQQNKNILKSGPYVRLFKALFTEIPYCDDRTTVASVALYQSLVDVMCDPTSYEVKLQIATETLIQCCGGNTTPSGEMVGMCLSGRKWLLEHGEFSGPFVERLLGSVTSQDHGCKTSFRLLVGMLRTLPDIAIVHWGSFCNLLNELSSGDRQRHDIVIRLKILEAFMLGRKDFSINRNGDKNVSGLVCSVLNGTIEFEHRAVHHCVLAIYASFLSEDWRELAENNQLNLHFQRIKLHCHDLDGKLRELACKSIAELCTQTFGSTESRYSTIGWETQINAKEICSQLLRCCNDSNSAVRAMAVFALGNLTDAIRMSQSYHLLDEGTLRYLLRTLLEIRDDSNDKVTSNTIRCVGHAGFVISKVSGASSTEVLSQVVACLNEKLSFALTVALNEDVKAKLTWKQRSRAKKHGWGACHSLGQIFQALPNQGAEEASIAAECSYAFQNLVICLGNYDIVNVKMIMAAMEAICNFPPDWMIYLAPNKGIVGTALTNAILLLFMSKDGNHQKPRPDRILVAENLVKWNESLLRYLLRSFSISDAKFVLTDERISSEELSIFYHWLVEQDQDQVDASVFENFSLGLSSLHRWSDSIALEQNFASRAVQMYKYADKTSHGFPNAVDLGEGDEL
jgi:hypothetical protein